MNRHVNMETEFRNQYGGGMLSIVAVLGGVIMLVQGSVYYRAKTSAAFLGTEKSKVLAMQMAEAGIEENIADIGTRKLQVREGMRDTVTYDRHSLGGGTFTSILRPVAMGAEADTVDLNSTGSMGKGSHSVQARLRLLNFLDTSLKIDTNSTPITVTTFSPRTVQVTTWTTLDPNTLPPLNTTSAYAACMASASNQCDVCHIPPGNPENARVIRLPKRSNSMEAHFDHSGCYISTDGTCDLYEPDATPVVTTTTVIDTLVTVTNQTAFDTLVVVDTLVKVQILSWK